MEQPLVGIFDDAQGSLRKLTQRRSRQYRWLYFPAEAAGHSTIKVPALQVAVVMADSPVIDAPSLGLQELETDTPCILVQRRSEERQIRLPKNFELMSTLFWPQDPRQMLEAIDDTLALQICLKIDGVLR